MRILFVRHAIAISREDFHGADDLNRPLTDVGRKKARRAFRGLLSYYGHPDQILHSAASRAVETAAILNELSGVSLKEVPALNPGAEYDALLSILDEHEKAGGFLAIIGHEPDLSEFVSGLIQSHEGRPAYLHLNIKKAACIEVQMHGRGAGELVSFLPPRLLRRLT